MSRESRFESPRWLDRYLLLLLLAFVAVCLGPSLLGFNTLLSVNLFSDFWPWLVNGDHRIGHETCTGDTIDVVMPSLANARHQLFSGHLPNWQGATAGGASLGDTTSMGLLDPLAIPYYIFPLWLAPAFVKLFELVTAIGGLFLYARRIGLSRSAGLLGGFVFATSGFMVVWSNWPQTRVAALIPLVFWSVERLIQRGRATDVAVVGLVIAAIVFGGFPAVTGLTLYLAAGYLIVRSIVVHRDGGRRAWVTVGLGFGGLVLGLAITMVQLLPFAAQLQGLDLEYRADQATAGLPFAGLLSLSAPDAFSLCIGGGGPARLGVNPVELVAYIGAAALVLAVAGAASGFTRNRSVRSVRSYFVLGVVVIVWLAWGTPLLREALQHVPVFADNTIGRIRAVLGFVLAVLAAAGFDFLLRNRRADPPAGTPPAGTPTAGTPPVGGPREGDAVADDPAGRRPIPAALRDGGRHRTGMAGLRGHWGVIWAAAVWVAAIVVAAAVLRRAHQLAIQGGYWPDLKSHLWTPAWLTLAALLALALSAWKRAWAVRVAVLVVPVLVIAQGAWFFHTVLPGDRKSDFYPNVPAVQYLQANLGAQRFVGNHVVLYPSTALYYGLRTATGHAFHEDGWRDLLLDIDPTAMKSPTDSDLTFSSITAAGRSPILDRMAVKYVAFAPLEPPGLAEPLPAIDGAVAASRPATCTVPAEAIRGITVRLGNRITPAPGQRLLVNVTATDGRRTVSNQRYLPAAAPAGVNVSIPLAGEDFGTSGPITARVSISGSVAPGALAAVGGSLACAPILPQSSDGLRLVYADQGTTIFQRLTALPRIRWASASTVIASPSAQVHALGAGVPDQEVVLGDASLPVASGKPATISTPTDRYGRIVTDVNATGGGYLVIADALQQPGWSATVDGRRAPLVDADRAMGAVYVPPGQHRVVVSYVPKGQHIGAVISLLALLITAALFWSDRRRRSGVRRWARSHR